MERSQQRNSGLIIRAVRIWSGLILLIFVTSHLLNLSLGLISIEAMDAARPYLSGIWASPVLGPVLLASLICHFALGLWTIYRRPILRTGTQDLVQLFAGVMVVPLLALNHTAYQNGIPFESSIYAAGISRECAVTSAAHADGRMPHSIVEDGRLSLSLRRTQNFTSL